MPLEVMAFLGASPIRLYAEGWDEDLLEKRTRTAIRMIKAAGLTANFVTEDTTRSRPTSLTTARLPDCVSVGGTERVCVHGPTAVWP